MKKSGMKDDFAVQVVLNFVLFAASGCFWFLAEVLWHVHVVSWVAAALACIAFYVGYNTIAEKKRWPLLDPSSLWWGFW